MSRDAERDELEPERYELHAPPAWDFALERREFLGVAGGLFVLLCAPVAPAIAPAAQDPDATGTIGAWLHIGEDGAITVYTGKAEVGQDIRTSLALAVADELRVRPEQVRLVMADTDQVPFDAGTFGSRTTPAMATQLRRAAAAARDCLLDLAADRWRVPRERIGLQDGTLVDGSTGNTLRFGELTRGQKLTKSVGEAAQVTPAERWTVAGRPAKKVNGRALVTGRHEFASDLRRPGMLHGKVLRPPAFGARLEAAELAPAQAIEGAVVVRDGEFCGVAAPTEALAARALAAIAPRWSAGETAASAADLSALLRRDAPAHGGRGDRNGDERGSLEVGMAAAELRLEATYTCAYIAHAPLEPRAAVAEWQDGRLTVWTGTQRPFGVRRELAQAFRLPESQVRVIVPDTGSGYGGKHSGEAAVEAARLAKSAGQPVRLVWTREEEFTWAYFRPAGVIETRCGAKRDGTICAWEMHNYNSGAAGLRTPYAIEHQRVRFHAAESPLRQGSYRALAATANHFARETQLDELAHALALDPLELRRRNLRDERLRAVFEAAAAKFGWAERRAAERRGHGIAGGYEKGGYVATCAEVEIGAGGEVAVTRSVTAFECGAIVDPDNLRNQIEGAVVMGLGGALFERIDFGGGRITNPRFSAYRVPRFADVHHLEVVLVDRKDLPSAGAGETPIVAIAPAIGNAIFAATGKRLRALPLVPDGA